MGLRSGYFCGMFSISESDRLMITCKPADMRVGVNSMCGLVRAAGNKPEDGTVYVFVGKTRCVMKLLHWERGGYVVYHKRLERGRFYSRLFREDRQGFRPIRWDELVLLIEGISPKAERRKRFNTDS